MEVRQCRSRLGERGSERVNESGMAGCGRHDDHYGFFQGTGLRVEEEEESEVLAWGEEYAVDVGAVRCVDAVFLAAEHNADVLSAGAWRVRHRLE